MARPIETQLSKLLNRMRTQSMLAHAFEKTELLEVISIEALAVALSLHQSKSASSVTKGELNNDTFTQKKIGEWLSGKSALEKRIDSTLERWNQGEYKGAKEAYVQGPADSQLFTVLSAQLDSNIFYNAAGVKFKEFYSEHHLPRFSEVVRSGLDSFSTRNGSLNNKNVMIYLTMSVAFLRHSLISLHTIDYIVHHVSRGLAELVKLEKRKKVGKKLIITYPLSANLLAEYLVEMVTTSMRFSDVFKLTVGECASGVQRWEKVAEVLVPKTRRA